MIARIRASWGALAPEQRLAAFCALGLFLTMFLPWYSHSGFAKGRPISDTLSAWGAFSFVEAAVLLVSVSVLFLLFQRSEGRAFHLPGGDGLVITAAGAWVALLTFYRTLDKPDAGAGTLVGVEWGIFVAILTALGLAYAGNRIRVAHLAEPALPGEAPTVADDRATEPDEAAARAERRRERERARGTSTAVTHVAPSGPDARPERPEIDGGTQLSFDEQE